METDAFIVFSFDWKTKLSVDTRTLCGSCPVHVQLSWVCRAVWTGFNMSLTVETSFYHARPQYLLSSSSSSSSSSSNMHTVTVLWRRMSDVFCEYLSSPGKSGSNRTRKKKPETDLFRSVLICGRVRVDMKGERPGWVLGMQDHWGRGEYHLCRVAGNIV